MSGEVRIDLSQAPLDEEAEWHFLSTTRTAGPTSHPPSHLPSRYTPPHLTSRYSESPGSDFEDGYSLYKDRLEQVSSQLALSALPSHLASLQDGFYHRERGGGGSRRSWRSNSPGARRAQDLSLSPGPTHR